MKSMVPLTFLMAFLGWQPSEIFNLRNPIRISEISPTNHPITNNKSTNLFRCRDGKISFKSEAPLELIEAKSKKLQGLINPENQSFAWSVDVNSFKGFNGGLQQEHFNENYMETKKFPQATFAGKIIEPVDFQQVGTSAVRAKGILTVHGVARERIIKCSLEVKNNRLHVLTNFTVPLADHEISIPKIVHQKIAEEISVSVDVELVAE